jgi:hypothetical protein
VIKEGRRRDDDKKGEGKGRGREGGVGSKVRESGGR